MKVIDIAGWKAWALILFAGIGAIYTVRVAIVVARTVEIVADPIVRSTL